jgi:CheY-like chemotaxis protein
LVDGGLEFDVLITDHLMPGMHGTSLAREVLARRAAAHVLVISGYASLEEIAPDLPRLSKPFKRDELAACLATLASRGHS